MFEEKSWVLIMQVSIWPVTIAPGTQGLLHQNVCPAPGLLHSRKCLGDGPINDDVPGAGHLHQLALNMKIVNTVIWA